MVNGEWWQGITELPLKPKAQSLNPKLKPELARLESRHNYL